LSRGPAKPSAKPLRRDAAENRVRLLDAAAEVFAHHGVDAGVEEVARAAGVGMGTLYRRFPTKQALIDALVGDARRELVALARAAAQQPDGTGLELLLVQVGELQADRGGCLLRVWDQCNAELGAMRDFRRLVRELLASAQAHGRVRDEVSGNDITMVLWSLRGVIETTGTVAPQVWRRHLELVVAGLRPPTGRFGVELRERTLTDAQARRVSGPTH
jgi:AcrR family transcriptional regulator